MASPTPNLNMTYPAHGTAVNTWDAPLNADFDILDAVTGGTVTFAGGTAGFGNSVSLSQTQANNRRVTITGLLTNNFAITFPAIGGLWVIDNQTTGNFFVTAIVNASATTPINCGQGIRTLISSNAVDMYVADDSKVNIIPFAGNPNGSVAGTQALAATNTPPSVVWDYTDNVLYVCTTTGNAAGAVWTAPNATVSRGFDMPDNLGLTVTHTGGNLLNLAIVQGSGSNATAGSPIIVPFQTLSGTNFTGLPTLVNITGALSMTTNAVGATMGTVNSTPFRIWFALFNNAGTAVPAMRVCTTATSINPVAEHGVASTVSITGAATSAGVWYTPNGTTLTNCAFRLIGYSEYASGLATAGTYTADPTTTVLFGPGIKKPGDIVQNATALQTAELLQNQANGTLSFLNTTVAIVPTSTVNPIWVQCAGSFNFQSGGSGLGAIFQLARTNTAGIFGSKYGISVANNNEQGVNCIGIDSPATTSSVTYGITYVPVAGGSNNLYWNNTAAHFFTGGATQSVIIAQELMA